MSCSWIIGLEKGCVTRGRGGWLNCSINDYKRRTFTPLRTRKLVTNRGLTTKIKLLSNLTMSGARFPIVGSVDKRATDFSYYPINILVFFHIFTKHRHS